MVAALALGLDAVVRAHVLDLEARVMAVGRVRDALRRVQHRRRVGARPNGEVRHHVVLISVASVKGQNRKRIQG